VAPSVAKFPDPDPDRPWRARTGNMSLLEHLEEFRKRIVRAALGVAVGTLVAFVFIDRIVAFVLAPARRMLPEGTHFIYTAPGEAFSLYINIALIGGALMAMPFVMYQAWRFIEPALLPNEKKFVVPFVLLTSIGSVCGAAFSHFVVFPYMIAFFGTFNSPVLAFMPRVEDAFDLYVKMLIGMVIVFQIPTLAFFLAKFGLVTARFLWRHTNYAILIIFIIAAVVTPSTDPWNQTIFAMPMVALYLLSIAIAWAVEPKRPR